MQIVLRFTACCYSCIYLSIAANANESEVSHIHRNDLTELQNKVDIYTETSPTIQIWIFPPVAEHTNLQTHKHWKLQTAMCSKTCKIQTITSVQKNRVLKLKSNTACSEKKVKSEEHRDAAETSLSLGGAEHCTREIIITIIRWVSAAYML